MFRSLSCSAVLLLTLAACKTGTAPASDAVQTDAGLERSTALGQRSTFTGVAGTWNFGAQVANGSHGNFFVTEQADDTVCDTRLRHFVLEGEGRYADAGTYECPTPSDYFGQLSQYDGTVLSGAERYFDSAFGTSHAGSLVGDDTVEFDGFGHASVVLDWATVAIAAPDHGVSGAVYIFENQIQIAKLAHPGVMEFGGFGSALMGAHDLLIVSDAFGRQFGFTPNEGGNWLEVQLPGDVLAVHEGTVLVRPTTGSDLRFYDLRDGTWEATGVLFGANLPYTEWAFDDVAAFAVQPGAGNFRGFADRYTRIDGELDATVRFTTDHTGLDLDLSGDFVIVSEAMSLGTSGSGQVHVFDWSDDRRRLLLEMSCPSGDDAFEPNDTVDDATLSMDGEFNVNVASPEDYFYVGLLNDGERATVDLAILGEADIDLYLEDEDGNILDSSVSITPTEQVVYDHSGDPIPVFARAKLFGSNQPCGDYSIAAVIEAIPEPLCGNPDNDTFETATSYEFGVTDAELDSAGAIDWYEFSGVFANEEITATLGFDNYDLDICLKDADGNAEICAAGTANPEILTYQNTTDEDQDLRLEVRWFAPPSDPTCVPYTLELTFNNIEEESEEDAPPAP